MLQIGDKVEVLDDVIRGKVVKLEDEKVTILTTEGFELKFHISEVIKIKEDDSLKFGIFPTEALEKDKQKKRSPNTPRKKEKKAPPMEVDLHIHQLTNLSKRMTNHEMLTLQVDTARHKLEFAIRNRIQRIVFIHGVGEGVLRSELEFLFGRYSNVTYYDAEYATYGAGATEVYIYQN